METVSVIHFFGASLIDWFLFYLTNPSKLPWPLIIPLLVVYAYLKKIVSAEHTYWNTVLPKFQYSPKEFYSQLKTELLTHNIKGLKFSWVDLKEDGPGTPERRYLRVERKGYQYIICAAPFADGFFVSWRLKRQWSFIHVLINGVPFVGGWLARLIFPTTYYAQDCASMFMTYTQQSVVSVVETMTKDSGFRLPEDKKKPVLSDIFNR